MTSNLAVQRGAELLGEAFLWSIGVSILLHQHYRERDEKEREEKEKEKRRISKDEILRHLLASSDDKILSEVRALDRKIDLLKASFEEQENRAQKRFWFWWNRI